MHAFSKKISPKLGAITQRMPNASSAHTASSRELPQPKFRSRFSPALFRAQRINMSDAEPRPEIPMVLPRRSATVRISDPAGTTSD